MTLKKGKLTDYLKCYSVEWADKLPEDCPPEDILIPENQEVYRFLSNENKIVDEDWINYAELHPENPIVKQYPIHASGLSVYIDQLDKVKKLPSFKNFKSVARVKLVPIDGVLVKSFGDSHYTWWRTTSFDFNKVEIVKTDET